MKKILSFVALIASVAFLNAQTHKTMSVEQGATSLMTSPQNSLSERVIANAPTSIIVNPYSNSLDKQFVHKSTYTPLEWMGSWEYALNYAPADSIAWNGNCLLNIFPDTMLLSKRIFPGTPSTITGEDSTIISRSHFLTKLGYTFDPYSKAFSAMFDKQLFYERGITEDNNTYLNYRIDSIALYARYRIGAYHQSTDARDTLRLYVMQYSAYDYQNNYPGRKMGARTDWEYVFATTSYVDGYKNFSVQPAWQRIAPATSPKGVSTRPKATNMKVYDYILDPEKDSAYTEMGKVKYKAFVIDMEPYEIKEGYVVSFLMEFLPGYTYDLNDTLEKQAWSIDRSEWIYDTACFNYLEIPYCRYTATTEGYRRTLDNGDGANGKSMEDKAIRYENDTSYSNGFWNGLYVGYYYIMPRFQFKISTGTDSFIDDRGIEDANVSKMSIYPNPAKDQITINLGESGKAEATLYNLIGQVVKKITLTEQSSTISVEDVTSGIYMLRVNQNGKVQTQKISIAK